MAEKVVFAKTSVVLAHGGQRVPVRAGEPWDGDDALVKSYPDMFIDTLASVRSTTDPRGFTEVETATRGPGEKRNARRPRTSGGSERE